MNQREPRSGVDPDLEKLIRDELHGSIVPPATPAYLAARVERIGRDAMIEQPHLARLRFGRSSRRGLGRAVSPLGGLVAAVVVATLIAAALGLRSLSTVAPYGGSPSPTASAPAPSRAPGPTFPVWTDNSTESVETAWAPGLVGVIEEGGRLHVTTDGGHTWSPGRVPPMTDGIDFIDADHAYGFEWATVGASATAVLHQSADGGKTWTSSTAGTFSAATSPDAGWMVVGHFWDVDHGMLMTTLVKHPSEEHVDCRVRITSDGGATWTDEPGAPCLFGNYGLSTNGLGWVAGAASDQISITQDAGRTWRSGTLPPLPSESYYQQQGLTIGEDGQPRFVASEIPLSGPVIGGNPLIVFRSADGQGPWTEDYRYLPDGAGSTIFSVTDLTALHWKAILKQPDATVSPAQDTYRIAETWDAGRTWSSLPLEGMTEIDTAHFWDDLHGMAHGTYMPCNRGQACSASGAVFMTDDGGRTWHHVPF